MAQFVDWDLAAATAAALGKNGPHISYAEATAAVADLRRLTDEATGHVAEYTGMRSQVPYPAVNVVDRRDWALANIEGLRAVMNPLADRLSGGKKPHPAVEAVGSRATGVQAGAVLAYLSGRVLGQFEVFASDPGQLLLVAPNIVEAERKINADPRDFRLWVCLHEVTHRMQFTAVPWMRGHFLGEVGALVDASQLDSGQIVDRIRRGLTAIVEAVHDPDASISVIELIQTPAQRVVFDRLTALMTLLEGHAEFVMDAVGPEIVPSVAEIRAKFNQRRASANPVERVIRKALGIEIKLRQYAEGRAFVHRVVELVGIEGFNAVWQSPLTLPRLAELSDPDSWVARVHGGADRGEDSPAPADGVIG
ncbi:MAG: zinc-dependent metalloprotease [Micromonosporaceae bacterium]|nr:zinc-dependent metalloprotease [Micromonosporaceae bacterium]